MPGSLSRAHIASIDLRRLSLSKPVTYRRNAPRFQGDNFQRNVDLVARIEQLAAHKQCTASQLALAWVLAQGDDVVPIFGTTRRKYLEENLRALEVNLTVGDLQRIEEISPRGAVAGERYPEHMLRLVNS